jgi:hypothetical protein
MDSLKEQTLLTIEIRKLTKDEIKMTNDGLRLANYRFIFPRREILVCTVHMPHVHVHVACGLNNRFPINKIKHP